MYRSSLKTGLTPVQPEPRQRMLKKIVARGRGNLMDLFGHRPFLDPSMSVFAAPRVPTRRTSRDCVNCVIPDGFGHDDSLAQVWQDRRSVFCSRCWRFCSRLSTCDLDWNRIRTENQFESAPAMERAAKNWRRRLKNCPTIKRSCRSIKNSQAQILFRRSERDRKGKVACPL